MGKVQKRLKPTTKCRFLDLNTFIDFTMGHLPPAAVKVWFVLFRDTKPDGRAKVGQADIARRAGISERAVRTAVRALEKRQLLKILRKGKMGKGPSVYSVQPSSQCMTRIEFNDASLPSTPPVDVGQTCDQTFVR